jgi:RNA-directed DNA polymerase
LANWKREEPVDEAKPFKIPKREVWEAFKHVKANQGAAGVDGQSIAEFEANLSGNLYKLWNRLSWPEPIIAKISQERLAEMIGTTRTRELLHEQISGVGLR